MEQKKKEEEECSKVLSTVLLSPFMYSLQSEKPDATQSNSVKTMFPDGLPCGVWMYCLLTLLSGLVTN